MNILVDTCVWSLALRRSNINPADPWVAELHALIQEGRAAIIGPIRQEILSGIRNPKQFDQLKERLSAFPDIGLIRDDYERAAERFNLCRGRGIQGSNTDFLICAVSERRNLAILTTDKDYQGFAQLLPLHLARPRGEVTG